MTRFHVDLLHPGWVAQTWQDWFIGPRGARRLALFAVGCVGVLLLGLVAGILPIYWRLSNDLNAVPKLQKDLATVEADLRVLRSNLQALTQEARRQVRWAELMTTFSQQIPTTLKLQAVESTRVAPAGGSPQQQAAAAKTEGTLRIDAVTPLRPGSPPLLDIAQFMAGLMRDPAVNKRFLLKSWEVKPPSGGGEQQFLNIGIVLSERPQ